MAESRPIDKLRQERTTIILALKRTQKYVAEKCDVPNFVDLQCRLRMLQNYVNQAMKCQTEMEKLDPEEDFRGELEELCISIESALRSKMTECMPKESNVLETTINQHVPATNRLPTLKIPKFSGKYKDYKNFIGCFKQLVDNEPTLTTIEKFNHLIASLTEDALRTVKAFQITDANYSLALKRLEERYDNKCLIFKDLIDSLFDIPKMSRPNSSILRQIVDDVTATFDSLTTIGTETEICHALIIHLVMSKVDYATKSKWDESNEFKTLPNWPLCTDLLIKRCQYLDMNVKSPKEDIPKHNKSNSLTNERKGSASSFLSSSNQRGCVFCSIGKHPLSKCSSFLKLNPSKRIDFVKRSSICSNCLNSNHSIQDCKSSKCKKCNRTHHTLLHLNSNEQNASPSFHTEEELPSTSWQSSTNNVETNIQAMHALSAFGQTILATAVVRIKDRFGNRHLARALLDSGSQSNFIIEDLAQQLSLKRSKAFVNISGIGESCTKIKHQVNVTIESRINNYVYTSDMLVIRSISGHHPAQYIPKENLKIPSNLPLADPTFNSCQKVDLLLGAECFYEFLTVGQLKLGLDLPILQKTLLGWIVSGKYKQNTEQSAQTMLSICSSKEIEKLNSIMKCFWELEEIPEKHLVTEEQRQCEQHFTNNMNILSNGRFMVRLPFKGNPSSLGSSYETARRRLLSLENRLAKTPDVQKLYSEFMKEYIVLGHMSKVSNFNKDSLHYFIPHHSVIRPDSLTTKLRVVFDASCKTSSGVSLNDILMVGPTIQPDLFTALLKFRLNRFAIKADITKMYRQVLIHNEDRKFQLILWRESPQDPLDVYQLNTITYGTASAPFLAIRCLKEISERYQDQYPVGCKVLNECYYVDDMLSGADNLQELEVIRQEVVSVLNTCGFELAKWSSNYPKFADSSEISLNLSEECQTKTLGINWIPKSDLFTFGIKNDFINLKATKRNILSVSSRLFDPLGLLAPIIITAKIILQDLWLNKLDWDESIPLHLETAWNRFKVNLLNLVNIEIPRFVNTTKEAKISIHGFADASVRAYGCCIYISSKVDGEIKTTLLVGKSKVSPLKTKSLPRLELCAVHLLSKLWNKIRPELWFQYDEVTFWTDSEIVLFWLKKHPSALNTFVANRISEIQDSCGDVHWRHVPTKMNPADFVSRGCDVETLIDSIWLQGPEFLCQDQTSWPSNNKINLLNSHDNLEIKKNQCLLSCNVIKPISNEVLEMVKRHSTFTKVVRIVAYVYRFINNTRSRSAKQSSAFSTMELEFAFLKIISMIQMVEFQSEISELEKSATLTKSFQRLNPFLQEFETNGKKVKLLRVGGRLLNAPVVYDTKFPLLMPKNSHFVQLYLSHLHLSNCHAGAKLLVTLLRQKIWLVNAREAARKIVRNCVICFKYKPRLLNQIMGNLPSDRFRTTRPFFVTGVDLCGPVYITLRIRGKPLIKSYIVVFVCFSTRAVHLEATVDLSTDSFLSCLHRFIGRRGLPSVIWSDNAKNFIGAARFLNSPEETKMVQQSIAEKGVELKFIPPCAPHMGGLWEAAVKSAKHLLVRTIGCAKLTYEELVTVLVDVEAVLNSRPLFAPSEDPSDGEVLTPGHFLIGCSLKALPNHNLEDRSYNCLKKFRTITSLKEKFWSDWVKEYVHAQQQRTKWLTATNNIQIGTVVTIHDENRAPQHWVLGKVNNVFPGPDGKVRVAEVQTSTGVYKRAIHKLAPLPIY